MMDGPQDCKRRQKNCATDESYVGKHRIKFRTSRKLQERFSKIKRAKNTNYTGYRMTIEDKISKNLVVHLSSNCYGQDITKAVVKIVRRDWPQFENGQIGQVFVPKIFVSKYPEVIDHRKYKENVNNFRENNERSPEETKLLQNKGHIEGEMLEKKIYNGLKLIFTKLNDDVMVVHGIRFMELADQNKDEIVDFEKDFLIINFTRRFVMSLEVKSCLGKNDLKKAKQQINGSKVCIDEWLGATFTEENGWKFIGVICFGEKAQRSGHRFCNDCKQYVIVNFESEFEEKLENIIKDHESNGYLESKKAKEEFFEASYYLLFFAAFDPVLISTSQLSQQIIKNLNKAGSAENIEVWRCWTPNQFPMLKGKVKKVIFISAPSTGKTTMMTSEACYLAKDQSEEVSFIIPGTLGFNQKTLLALSLESEFKNYDKVEVCCVKRTPHGIDYQALLNLVKSRKKHHIFIDELHLQTNDDINILEEIAKLCKDKTLWMVITSMNNELSFNINSELKGFHIPDGLIYPLRNTSTIVKCAYSLKGMTAYS